VRSLQQGAHEPLLAEDLECWRCRGTFKTLPKLKEHLTREKEAEASRKKKVREDKKQKSPEDVDVDGASPDDKPSSGGQAATLRGGLNA